MYIQASVDPDKDILWQAPSAGPSGIPGQKELLPPVVIFCHLSTVPGDQHVP